MNTNYCLKINSLTLTSYQFIRSTTDWVVIEDENVEKAIANDLFSVVVYDEVKPIGMGRVIGDGQIYFYVQDVIVIPSYQKQSIGKIIMEEIEKYISMNAPKNAFIGLMSAKNTEGFYQKYNYKVRMTSSPGMFKIIS